MNSFAGAGSDAYGHVVSMNRVCCTDGHVLRGVGGTRSRKRNAAESSVEVPESAWYHGMTPVNAILAGCGDWITLEAHVATVLRTFHV
jgi:hypothetical protein